MRFDQKAIRDAQRLAFMNLAQPVMMVQTVKDGKLTKVPVRNQYHVKPENIQAGALLVQEQPFVNTQNEFTFVFDTNAPQPTPALGNVLLGKTNVACVYGIQLLIGEGALANNRIYRSRGITPNDDSIYNSNTFIKFESSSLVDKIGGQFFRDVETAPGEFWAEAGMYLLNPQRYLSGEIGTFEVHIRLINSIAALALSANLFLSMRLHIALGQASATR